MSLKPVEMQIAIPRTTEATHFQNQLIQKPALDQAELADANAKRSDQQRNMSEEIEKTDFLNVREDGRSGRQYGEQPKKTKTNFLQNR